ncbi:MAG: carboxymuconolactone decarboxylase family protein [Planctomycetales bacterium]|nr:carboxymuconolactone decarboxylase family protein [Planctomycetales bacterium]
MAWIPYLAPADVPPETRAILDRLRLPWAECDNVLRVHAANPPVLAGHVALYEGVLHRPSPLSRLQRELIGVVVSAANRCEY